MAASDGTLTIVDLCDPQPGQGRPPTPACALCGGAVLDQGWQADWAVLGVSARAGRLDDDEAFTTRHRAAAHAYCVGVVRALAGAEARALLAYAIPRWPAPPAASPAPTPDPRELGAPAPAPPASPRRPTGLAALPEPVLRRIAHHLPGLGDLLALQGTCGALRALALPRGACAALGAAAARAFVDALATEHGWDPGPTADDVFERPLAEAFACARGAEGADTLRWWLVAPGWRARRAVWACVAASAAAARDAALGELHAS
ncbi:hypothetical protein Q8F55_006761 [Vanrija albida]|uniref:F-box domain-containing protein n=1 Tax=Vanrija albida TaxID=181172 RepID=A0ABR3PY16_9TREE